MELSRDTVLQSDWTRILTGLRKFVCVSIDLIFLWNYRINLVTWSNGELWLDHGWLFSFLIGSVFLKWNLSLEVSVKLSRSICHWYKLPQNKIKCPLIVKLPPGDTRTAEHARSSTPCSVMSSLFKCPPDSSWCVLLSWYRRGQFNYCIYNRIF